MAIRSNNINELVLLLRENGDKILDTSSKLSLSATLLVNLNKSLMDIKGQKSPSFKVDTCDLQFICDFIQQTLALKLLPDTSFWNNEQILDINIFKNLKLLEIQRLSINLIKGIKNLRARLEYLICVHSLNTLKEVLETCGADDTQGFIWHQLKEAVFSYNSLVSLDNSLQFVPWLNSLDLSHNRIQNAQILSCLPNLKYLNIGYNQLESVPAFRGKLCNHLQVLVLRNNFIEDIQELATLVNLCELDLSNNFLLEHSCLISLYYLPLLKSISLAGNPLSFHPQHRKNTVNYLNVNVTQDFILENTALSKKEKQFVGLGLQLNLISKLQLESVSLENNNMDNSSEYLKNNTDDIGMSSGMHSTTSSVIVKSIINLENNVEDTELLHTSLTQENICMQDSGIAEGRRPSISELSIGSASSLTSIHRELKPCHQESDIEILSNPSQSSIEVIISDSRNRYGLTSEIQRKDLYYINCEQRKSL